jgi:hypothetical protein
MKADVYDHMEHILVNLDMYSGIAENLIAYSFNVCAFSALHVQF